MNLFSIMMQIVLWGIPGIPNFVKISFFLLQLFVDKLSLIWSFLMCRKCKTTKNSRFFLFKIVPMNHNNDDLGWHGINHKKLWSNQSIAQKIVNCNFFVPSSPICRHRFGALIDNCGEWQKNSGTQNLILARQMSLASSPDRPNLTLSRMIKWSWGWSNREAPRNIHFLSLPATIGSSTHN